MYVSKEQVGVRIPGGRSVRTLGFELMWCLCHVPAESFGIGRGVHNCVGDSGHTSNESFQDYRVVADGEI